MYPLPLSLTSFQALKMVFSPFESHFHCVVGKEDSARNYEQPEAACPQRGSEIKEKIMPRVEIWMGAGYEP